MSPVRWALRPLRRYAEFSGRSSRAEFWWFFPFLMPVFLATWLGMIIAIGSTVSAGDASSPPSAESSSATDMALGAGIIFLGLSWLALIVPTAALQIRRLHDTDRSGWWVGAFYLIYGLCIVLALAKVGAELAGLTAVAAPNDPIMAGAVGLWLVLMVLLIFFSLPGTTGFNRFGDDPYGAKLEHIFA
jgi:uncharacterized membrane protein YhaH (DUF805 family)